MTCSYQNRKEECGYWSKEGDVSGMLSEHLLSDLYHPVHTSGRLEGSGTGNGGNDDVYDICGRSSRLHSEAEYQNCKAYT